MDESTNDPCVLLEWDSGFFGFPIARVHGDVLNDDLAVRIDAWCRQQNVSCLYFPATSNDPNTTLAAERHGFRLVDVRSTFERTLTPGAPKSEATRLRVATAADLPTLRAIARENHHDSRFYADDRFFRDSCDRLYECWIERSCNGYADRVLVAESNGHAAGYISCHRMTAQNEGSIGLLGVARQARGQGLGGALVAGAVSWFAGEGLAAVSVVTQARNVTSQRLYQRCGFVTRSVQLYYHKWYSAAASGDGAQR